MKTYIIISALLFSGILCSQNKQTKLEAFGNIVKATYYYDNGQVSQQGFYQNGKLEGEWVSYDSNGNKTAIANYNKGTKIGKWFFWNNSALSEVDYSNNSIASVKNWKRQAIVSED